VTLEAIIFLSTGFFNRWKGFATPAIASIEALSALISSDILVVLFILTGLSMMNHFDLSDG
jgi:hypothetical protein